MAMSVRTETAGPDRTLIVFRDSDGMEHWDIGIQTEPHGRAYYVVRRDGWVVYEVTARELRINESGAIASEIFACGKMRASIPAEVLSHIPKLAK